MHWPPARKVCPDGTVGGVGIVAEDNGGRIASFLREQRFGMEVRPPVIVEAEKLEVRDGDGFVAEHGDSSCRGNGRDFASHVAHAPIKTITGRRWQ